MKKITAPIPGLGLLRFLSYIAPTAGSLSFFIKPFFLDFFNVGTKSRGDAALRRSDDYWKRGVSQHINTPAF
jgi:hypothetical protein